MGHSFGSCNVTWAMRCPEIRMRARQIYLIDPVSVMLSEPDVMTNFLYAGRDTSNVSFVDALRPIVLFPFYYVMDLLRPAHKSRVAKSKHSSELFEHIHLTRLAGNQRVVVATIRSSWCSRNFGLSTTCDEISRGIIQSFGLTIWIGCIQIPKLLLPLPRKMKYFLQARYLRKRSDIGPRTKTLRLFIGLMRDMRTLFLGRGHGNSFGLQLKEHIFYKIYILIMIYNLFF